MVQIAITGLVGLAALLPQALALPGVQRPVEPMNAEQDAEGAAFVTAEIVPRAEAHMGKSTSSSGVWSGASTTNRNGWTETAQTVIIKSSEPSTSPKVSVVVLSTSSAAKPASTTSSAQPIKVLSTTNSVSSAAPTSSQPASPGSCSVLAAGKTFKDPISGDVYEITCGYDYYDSDLTYVSASDYAGCFKACSEYKTCNAFSFTGGNGVGNCYLKYATNGGGSAIGVDTAKLVSHGNGSPVVVVTPTKASVSSTTAVITTSPTAGVPGSCTGAQKNGQSYISPAGANYTIECGRDHNGGDLVNIPATSFVGCASACDNTVSCIGYAYVGGFGPGTCYLKSSITSGETDAAVDFAYKPKATSDEAPLAASTGSTGTNSVAMVTKTRPVAVSVPVVVQTMTRPTASTTSTSSTKAIIIETPISKPTGTKTLTLPWTSSTPDITTTVTITPTNKAPTSSESTTTIFAIPKFVTPKLKPSKWQTKTRSTSGSTDEDEETTTITVTPSKPTKNSAFGASTTHVWVQVTKSERHHHKTKEVGTSTASKTSPMPTETTVTRTGSGKPTAALKPQPKSGQSWDDAYCYAIAEAENYLQAYAYAGNRAMDGWFVGAFNPSDQFQNDNLLPNLTPYLDKAWKGVGLNERENVLTGTGTRRDAKTKERISCESWDMRVYSDDDPKAYGKCSWARGRGSKVVAQNEGNITSVDEKFGSWIACPEKQTAVLRWHNKGRVGEEELKKCALVNLKLVDN